MTIHSKFKIDSDVPMPTADPRGKPEKYPFSKLSIGQSFFVPGANAAISAAATSAKKRTGFRFKVRSVEEGGLVGKRVWRVE